MSVILQYLRAALLSGQGAGSRASHRQGKREEYCESAPHSPNLIDLIDAAGAWLLGDEGTNRYPRWAGLPLGSRLRVDEAEVLSALLLLPVEADGALVNGLGTASRDELQARTGFSRSEHPGKPHGGRFCWRPSIKQVCPGVTALVTAKRHIRKQGRFSLFVAANITDGRSGWRCVGQRASNG